MPPSTWLKHTLLDTIKSFIHGHKKVYLIACTCLITIGLIDISIPWLVGNSIDRVRANELDSTGLWQLFFLLLCMGLAMYGLRYVWRLILFGTSYRLSVSLRNYLYERLSKLGPSFFQAYRTGDLMARATNDVDNIEMTVGEAVLAAFDGLLTFVLVVAFMMIAIDWRLALIALIPFPIMTYVFRILGTKIHAEFTKALDRFSDLNDHTQQALHGLKPMRALGLQHILKSDFDDLANKARQANVKVAKIESLFDPLVVITLGCSTLLSLAAGSWLIAHDEITLGQLTSFYLYQGYLIWPMFAFGWFLNLYQRGSAAHARLHEILLQPDSIQDNGETTTITNTSLSLQLNSFHYKTDLPNILGPLSLNVKAGETLGIVGPSGSGKTTLLNLLQRHYVMTNGQLQLGECDIQEYPLSVVRDVFSMVPQDPILFSDTLKANIALGNPSASDELILSVARLAQLTTDINQLPMGLATVVGEKGVTLSGGQRQRIALSRALLRDTPILCLDDTLSAVDAETENKLLNMLQKKHGQQTLIIVAHRLSAVKSADHIIVLNHGRITEQGNHETLMQQDGWYAHMYAHQQLELDLE